MYLSLNQMRFVDYCVYSMQANNYFNPSEISKYKLLFELDGTIMLSDFSNYEQDCFTNYALKLNGVYKVPEFINIDNATAKFYSYFKNGIPKNTYESQPFLLNHIIKTIESTNVKDLQELARLDNLIYNVEIPSLSLNLDSLFVDPDSKFKLLSLVLSNE